MRAKKSGWNINLTAGYYRCVILLCISTVSLISARTIFVAPNGNDSYAGTIGNPYGSLGKGNDEASAGDTVYLRGGTYNIRSGINIANSGSSDANRIYFLAYPDERPVFDFSGITSQSNGLSINNSNWLYFKGIEFKNVPQLNSSTPSCVAINNSGHVTMELCEFHHNGGTGLFLNSGTGGHRILNCDSHNNYDPISGQGDGQNADGIGVHYQQEDTDVSIISGCRAWWNSDDGIDFIHQNTSVILENTWVWLNGYRPGTTIRPAAGNGTGIKAGGYDLPPNRVPTIIPVNVVRNCVSFLNADRGFNTNYHPVANIWYNNTAFNNNSANYFMQGITYQGGSNYVRTNRGILRNNLSFMGTSISNGTGSDVDAAYNSWDMPGITVSSGDFLSIDTAGVFGPRKADGSLPDVNFLHLAQGSDLIDAGEDVGLPFTGTAPDLGAFEFGSTVSISLPSEKKSPSLTRLPKLMNGGEYFFYDLSGRRITPAAYNNTYRIVIREKKSSGQLK